MCIKENSRIKWIECQISLNISKVPLLSFHPDELGDGG